MCSELFTYSVHCEVMHISNVFLIGVLPQKKNFCALPQDKNNIVILIFFFPGTAFKVWPASHFSALTFQLVKTGIQLFTVYLVSCDCRILQIFLC